MQPEPVITDDAARILREAEARAKANGNHVPVFDGLTNTERLDEVVKVFRKWLYIPDSNAIFATLAAAAANAMQGDPLWLLLVGSPGCGKTEIILSLSTLPHFFTAGTLTEASLLSGSPKREQGPNATGGLLRAIGQHGTIVLKDFGSVLSLANEKRGAVLAALREIYDGSWTRALGSDGGKVLSWTGKCGLLGGCTPAIDSHHSVMASLGERFLLYRMPVVDAHLLATAALNNVGDETKMRAEIVAAVGAWFKTLKLPNERVAPDEAEHEFLIPLSLLVVRARSAVERDGRTREIEAVPPSEAPGRIARALAQLLAGARAIGIPEDVRHGMVRKVALDCIPALRRKALEEIAELGKPGEMISTGDLAERLDHPTGTVRRALEDLTAHQILRRRKTKETGSLDFWGLTDATAAEWEKVR